MESNASTYLFLLLIIGILVFFIVFIPKCRVWYKKRLQVMKMACKRDELYKTRRELQFHMSWAKERGEGIEDFEVDLAKIDSDIQQLDERCEELEMFDISKR